MRSTRLSLIIAVGMMRVAGAEPSPTERADALFEEGRKRIDAHDYAGACAKFGEAIRIDPDAEGTMLNLGLCNENLHKYKRALFWFRKAQARAHETNKPEHEKAAGEHTVKLADQIATVTIVIAGATPAGTRVRLDEDDIEETDFSRVEIDAGHHVLEASAPGRKTFRQDFEVVDKGGQTLTITMVPGSDVVAAQPVATHRSLGPVLAVGAAALAAMGGAVALELSAESIYNNAKDAIDPGAQDDLWHRANRRRYIAEGLGVAGVATAGVALWLYFRGNAGETRTASLTPYASADGIGLVVGGVLP